MSNAAPDQLPTPTFPAGILASHLGRCVTLPVVLLLLLAAGSLAQILRLQAQPRYMFLLAGSLVSVSALFGLVKALLRRATETDPTAKDRIAFIAALVPYLFGSYLTFYEGLWRLSQLRGGFSLDILVLAVVFTVAGYRVVKGVYLATEIGRAIDEGRIRIEPRSKPTLEALRDEIPRSGGTRPTVAESRPTGTAPATARWLSLGVAGATIAIVAYAIDRLGGDPVQQLAHLFGFWFAGFGIIGALTWWLLRGTRSRAWRLPVALSLALILLVTGNLEELRAAEDARRAVEILSTFAGPADARTKLAANHESPLLALIRFTNEASEDAGKEISALFLDLTPPELDAPFSFETASNDELRERYRQLKTAQQNALAASSQVNFILQRQRARVAEHVERSSLDSGSRRGAIAGVAKVQKEIGDYASEVLRLKAQEFELGSQLLAILIREETRVYVDPTDGLLTFESQAALDAFQELLQDLGDTERELVTQGAKGDEIHARYQAEFEQLIATQ